MQNADYTDSLVTDIIVVIYPVMHMRLQSEFEIFKMASRLVADKFYKPMGTLPVGMSGGFVTYQISCLMEKHFTNTCI